MAIVLGLDAVLMRGTAGSQGTTEVKNVKDLTLNLESGEADVTTRATAGWRASVATLKEASLEFSILYDTEDTDYNAFATAYFNNTPLSLFVSDGNGTGLDADFWSVTNGIIYLRYLLDPMSLQGPEGAFALFFGWFYLWITSIPVFLIHLTVRVITSIVNKKK